MRWLAILAILGYRLVIRPLLRRRCLFDESCSAHAIRLLRERGVRRAVPLVRARIRSCRLPTAACFVVDASGRAQLLAATSHDGSPPPPRALALLAREAELHAGGHPPPGAD